MATRRIEDHAYFSAYVRIKYHVSGTVKRLWRESPVPDSIANYHIIEKKESVRR
jgi:hypothetical protein